MTLAASKATTAKILASVVLVGGAASVAGLGTFGAFTSTTQADQAVASGTVVLGLDKTGAQGLGIAAANMVPGDTIQRSVTLTRGAGSEEFGAVTLTTTSNGSILTIGNDDSMTLSIDSCATAWTVAADKSLTCTAPTTVLSGTVVGTNRPLPGVTELLNTDKAANLRVTLTLPAGADDTFQGKSDNVNFTFDATQRDAKNL